MCSECAFEPFCGADPVFHYLVVALSAGEGVCSFAKRRQDVLAFDGVEYAVAQHAGVLGLIDEEIDRIVAPAPAAFLNAFLG